MSYKICFGTGVGDYDFDGTLDAAKSDADDAASYTQSSITIIDNETGDEVSRRPWWGSLSGIDDEEDPIQFGDFGFYGDWQDA